ncbi:MAG: hypothetical protein G01um101466_265 [Parcubacteria group bacterium Gr01-1014_66]|nr:MAG: hypothetical protein G01um101466_265 [Parcubacteria group bacterium Gr01-1014_66]
MTLTTHSIIAAAIAKPLMQMNPLLAFVAALASHYLSDAIPHWDYPLASIEDKEDKEKRHWGSNRRMLMKDISRMALDGFLGAGILLLIVRPVTTQQLLWTLAVIIGGSLPDFLQGLYMLKLKFLTPHQRLHDIFHTNIRLGPYPLFGVPFQLVIAAIALYILI